MSNRSTFFMSPEAYEALKSRYTHFNEPWTPQEEESLRQMAENGADRAEMSRQLSRTPGSVKFKLQSMGLYTPKPSPKPWTEEEDRSVVEMYRQGQPFQLMADTLGRSESAVVSRLVRLRINLFEAQS